MDLLFRSFGFSGQSYNFTTPSCFCSCLFIFLKSFILLGLQIMMVLLIHFSCIVWVGESDDMDQDLRKALICRRR